MRILFAAAEAAPYLKVGGLADVAGALPNALARRGHEVRLVIPRAAGVVPRAPAGGPEVLPGSDPPVVVELVDHPYVTGYPVYGGEHEGGRFDAVCSAVLTLAAERWLPDVIHAHDWHTALLPVRIAAERTWNGPLAGIRTVLTIHNLAYQGLQGPGFADFHGLAGPPQPGDTLPDCVNVFGRGLATADAITTVSPGYAREILEPAAGHGLDRLLRERGVTGIVNGLDRVAFDPANDPAVPFRFDADHLVDRARNREALAAEYGLTGDGPIIGVVSRLAEQKGLDLLLAAAGDLIARGARIVLLGSGEGWLEDGFRSLAADHPDAAGVTIGFDDARARRIYAGSDLFAMPSRFEPCGLGQLIAMRYGSIPLVRRTGGLADTVLPCDAAAGTGTGFVFDDLEPGAIVAAFEQALATWRDEAAFTALRRRAMAYDSSWDVAAAAYEEIYGKVLA
jgi:starch synthase